MVLVVLCFGTCHNLVINKQVSPSCFNAVHELVKASQSNLSKAQLVPGNGLIQADPSLEQYYWQRVIGKLSLRLPSNMFKPATTMFQKCSCYLRPTVA